MTRICKRPISGFLALILVVCLTPIAAAYGNDEVVDEASELSLSAVELEALEKGLEAQTENAPIEELAEKVLAEEEKAEPETVTALDSGSIDLFTWDLTNDVLTISGNGPILFDTSSADWTTSLVKTLVIEEGVTSIGPNAFTAYENLTTVSLPESVTSIGEFAFDNCKKLKTINLPKNLQSIKDQAFWSCISLESIVIPGKVRIIGIQVFGLCSSLTSVTMEKGVREIDYGVFQNCSKLSSVSIPSTVIYIGNSSFENCKALKKITIPKSVKSVDSDAFKGCNKALMIKVGSKNYSYSKLAPKKTSIKKISVGKGQMTVTWKKLPASQGVTKYVVDYLVYPKGWVSKTYGSTKSSATIKKLKKGESYYVSLYSYKTVSGTKFFSPYDPPKRSKKIQ